MNKEELKQLAITARLLQIEQKLTAAANDGLYEIRLPKMFPEQITYVKAIGLKCREIEQKDGSEHEINWE